MPYYSGSVAAVPSGPVAYKVPTSTSRYTSSYRSGGSLERSYFSGSSSGSSYLSRSTGSSSSSYTSEYRSKFTSPARTSSSVPSYSRSSSLSDDTSSRFSSSRERAAEPRRFTASTLTAADIISKYSPATYLGGSGGGVGVGGGGSGGGSADVGRPPLGARASAASAAAHAHASASPAGDDKDAGVTTRSGTLRERAATVASSTSSVGRVAAPSLERRSRLPKEVNGRAAGVAGSGNNNASDSESSSASSSSSSPSRADDDDNGNGATPARVSEIRRRFDAASSAIGDSGASASAGFGSSGGHLAGGLAPDVPRLHHGAAAPVGGASSRRSALAAAAAPSPTPARKAYALAAPAAPPPASAPAPPAAAAAAAAASSDDDDSEEEEDEDAKSASEESSEEEAAGSEGGDAARAMTQPPPRRRPPERAAPTDAGAAGSPGERRATAYGARASVTAAPVASTTGAYSRTHRSSASDSGQWAGWRPSDLPAPPARTSNLQPHDAAAHSTRRSSTLSTLSTDYSYYPYRQHGSGAGSSAGAALGVALSAVAGPSRDSSILSSSPHLARAGSRCTGSERGGLSGLRNIGNTCFMNSVIQCLSNTKPLLEYLLGDAYLSDINTTVSSMKGALIKAFSSVIQELWRENDGMVVNTTSLKSQIQRFAPRFMGYSQQDAQEFLRYLLEGLHEDVNRVTSKPKPILTEIDDSLSDQQKSAEAWKRYLRMDDSKVVDIFVGQLKSTLRCTVCGHCSVTFDPFWDLSLPIPTRTGQVRLQQCLDSFTREEVLDGDEKPTCAKCQTRRKCTKNFTIQKFPKILVLHLKRFSPTERFRGKLSVTVDFPHTGLDMSAYAASRGQGCMYNLYAISNHSGTTYSGHYTAYCRHPYTGEWHEYNDSRVSSISPRSIVSSEAYVLFYELSGHSSHL